MSTQTFHPADHPRTGGGQFTEKPGSEPVLDLEPTPERTLVKFAGKQAPNYSSMPTIDVDILTDPRQCQCGTHIEYDPKGGTWKSGAWNHTDDVDTTKPCWVCKGAGTTSYRGAQPRPCYQCAGSGTAPAEHHVAAVTRCSYCGTQDPDEVTFVQASWSDETRCARCGGVTGYAIGD